MSDLLERFKNKCPLKLEGLPKSWESGGQRLHYCPLAVVRLKAIKAARAAGSELTEKEEARLPGCPYAIKSQMSGYCFFIQEACSPDTPMLDADISAVLDIPVEQVKLAAETALKKLQLDSIIVEIKEALDSGSILQERLSVEDEHIHFD
jgi:hypothetical protein